MMDGVAIVLVMLVMWVLMEVVGKMGESDF